MSAVIGWFCDADYLSMVGFIRLTYSDSTTDELGYVDEIIDHHPHETIHTNYSSDGFKQTGIIDMMYVTD